MFRRTKRTLFGIVAASVGAAIAYFFDPAMGRTRRARTTDQVAAKARRGADQARKQGTLVTDRAVGRVAEKVTGAIGSAPPNTPTLQHKVESEVLGEARFPSGSINVNAEDGKIVLRGTLPDTGLISDLEASVRQVDGVRDVVNLVHLPGQEAPERADVPHT